MNEIDKTGISSENETTLEELAGKFTSAPGSWILFLGNGVSAGGIENYMMVLSELARHVLCEAAPTASVIKELRQAVQEGKTVQLLEALFGNIWDGSSFLDADRERNIKLREIYAKRLCDKNKIDVYEENKNLYLQELIGKFQGIILTTCQDDTVEAFWEYEHSLPADNIMYTPEFIANSYDWRRWLYATDDELAYLKSQSEPPENAVILVKLFGSRDKPAKMLLSRQDIEKFYPPRVRQASYNYVEKDEINTIRFLKKIFKSKNILFVGVDFEKDWLLEAAEGIMELLEEEPLAGVERYALLCRKLDTSRYHIRTIGHARKDDSTVLEKLSGQMQSRQAVWADSQAEKTEEEVLLQNQEEILRCFFLFYNRHPQKFFLHRDRYEDQEDTYNDYIAEYDVLKRDILGFGDNNENSQKWDRKNIRQLAIAANNFSDFYDLRDAMELVKISAEEPHETTIQNLLTSRLSKKSLFLYRILQRYESGFPISFLQLLPREKYSLRAWRRAGIQLANSGVYIQRHGKQRLYERLSYADCVMRTAGRSPFHTRICNEIDAVSFQALYGYLYPFHKVEIRRSEAITSQEIDAHFIKMFRTLYDILRNKSEEYQQIYSLMQTEQSSILKMMRTLPDEKLDWKPGLLYYILKESKRSVDREEMHDYCNCLEKECNELIPLNDEEPLWQLFEKKLMLYQAKALIMCQSSKEDDQRAAMDECDKVENDVLDAEKKQTFWKGLVPKQIFEHRIYAYFLCSMIFGRMSTIQEIERCKVNRAECAEQASLLAKMNDRLDCAERLIIEREKVMGEQHRNLRSELARLKGEYYFKMSQYYGENRRFAEKSNWPEEEKYYRKSKETYMGALKYYNSNSVQRADIMRNMADMYCQWGRSITEVSTENQAMDPNCKKLIEECYDNLINAYVIYRRHFDIHGIADVLQSMGQAEKYYETDKNNQQCRSRLCYYKASMDMYKYMGDLWSAYVVNSFLKGDIGTLSA